VRTLVTGGTGFVGGAIVDALVAEGRAVVALARSQDGARALEDKGARPVLGDVFDTEALDRALEGCDVVYHAAGVNAFCLRDPAPMFCVNVDGARTVVEAAARAGVRRVVHTSSAATLGEERGTVGSERSPHRGWFLSDYERSKHSGERAAFEAARATGIELVSVNPASVQGPGRTHGTARLLLDYLNGKLPVLVDAQLSLVDVADCTRGHLLAESRGRPGERYVLSGATLTVREAVALLGRVAGIDHSPRTLPAPLAQAGATAVEAVSRLRRRRPPLCRELVRTLLHGHAYDGSRATRELGLAYTPLEETWERTLRWYVDAGLVRRPLPTPRTDAAPGPR
jgi:dihydroflavonol-4-reductase